MLTSRITTMRPRIAKVTNLLSQQIMRSQKYTSRGNVYKRVGVAKEGAKSLKERLLTPAKDNDFLIGKAALGGASLVGIGSLCYYGLGLSNSLGAVDRAALWSETTRQRVKDTYKYFAGSLCITAASAVAASRNATIMRFMVNSPGMALAGSLVMTIGSMIVVRSIPYSSEGNLSKNLAWVVHTSCIGLTLAPLALMGGALIVRAGWYTAGIAGGLSTLAMCAPSDKFLNMGAPLAMGLGVVFMSSIGSFFLPPTTAIGASLYSISLYGGLILFSMFLLYDTQKTVDRAERHPPYSLQPFDPINNCLHIYMDTINIFIRVATLLAGGGGSKRK